MSQKKELNEEELDKVTGGTGITNVVVKYKDTEDGEKQYHGLGYVTPPEQKAKDWCNDNNKIYVGYQINSGKTDGYNAQTLLASLRNN